MGNREFVYVKVIRLKHSNNTSIVLPQGGNSYRKLKNASTTAIVIFAVRNYVLNTRKRIDVRKHIGTSKHIALLGMRNGLMSIIILCVCMKKRRPIHIKLSY